MSDDNSDSWSIQLNRRNVLGTLGTVGAASALGGAGTMAWLNDTESFDGNVVTAGELNLVVGYETWYNGEMVEGMMGTRDGGTSAVGTLGDVKPGDWGTFRFCPESHTNPAYLWACGMLTANDENGQNEAERNHSDDDTTGAGNGELADSIRASLAYCGVEGDGRREIASGSLRDVLTLLQAGAPLDGTGDPRAGVEREPIPGSDAEPSPPCVCLDWNLPKSVGNEVQSDTLSFDLSFYAEQARHNDGATNPCVDESYSADYVNPEGIAQAIPGGTLGLDVSYGTEQVVYAIEFDESAADTEYHLWESDFASANFSMPFDADEDGIYDFQVAWNVDGGDEFHYSGVTGTPAWAKDTSAGWSGLPTNFSAFKSGNQALIAVPRDALDAGASTYLFGFLAGAGGEQPSVSIPDDGPYSSNDNWTSSENGLTTSLP
jgi:predicted ribosomally synthesized peptide with SipW-like signal peptide